MAAFGLTSRITSTPCLGSIVTITTPKNIVPPRCSSARSMSGNRRGGALTSSYRRGEPAGDLLQLVEQEGVAGDVDPEGGLAPRVLEFEQAPHRVGEHLRQEPRA